MTQNHQHIYTHQQDDQTNKTQLKQMKQTKLRSMSSGGYTWAHQIKSNQITFIVTSPQHKCLGEWNSYERAPDSAKKQNKNKKQLFTYGQYIFTDCTEDNVQNTHTYTQYTQCTIKTYLIINYTLYTVCAHLHYVHYLYIM